MSELRTAVVAEAFTWEGTPYRKRQAIKGHGVDCYRFIGEVFRTVGMILDYELPIYDQTWWLHAKDQEYFKLLLKFAREKLRGRVSLDLAGAKPGDIAAVRVDPGSEIFNHAGIVVAWPRIIHVDTVCCEANALRDPKWVIRDVVIFDPFKEQAGA